MKRGLTGAWLIILSLLLFSCDRNDPGGEPGLIQLVRAKVGTVYLDLNNPLTDIPVDRNAMIKQRS